MARILLDNLRKEFGKVVAVERLSLDVGDGQFVALLGPSGCGKTTTMNMIAGLERPTSGTIYFDDRPMNDVPPGKRNVGFVFQNYAIFTHMTVYDNLAFGLKIRHVPPAEIRKEVLKVAELLQLTDQLHQNAGRLSVNDMQKVAIGRTMIIRPSIFLLDEPFSNLDAAFRAYMRGELKRLQREIGQTMIYVTHDQVEAMSMADKIAVMDFGVLQQYGTPDEVYYKPVNMFVANFIGSPNMNFLTATYRVEGARAFAVGPQLGDGRVDLTPRRAALDAALKDDVVVLGIRPEHVVVRDRTEDAPLRGTVRLYEPLGPKTVVHVQLGEGGSLRVVSPPDFRPRPGTTLGLELPTEWLHVFDPTTRAAVGSGDRAAGI